MKTPARAAVILFILISILLFIVGIRLGKKIAQIDFESQIRSLKQELKKQNGKPKLEPFTVKKFVSTPCGVQFIYPAVFKESEAGTDEAKLTYQNQVITFHCNRSKIIRFNDRKSAMKSAGKRTVGEVAVELYPSELANTDYLYFTHPKNNKNILMRLPRSLWDLFAETVKIL